MKVLFYSKFRFAEFAGNPKFCTVFLLSAAVSDQKVTEVGLSLPEYGREGYRGKCGLP